MAIREEIVKLARTALSLSLVPPTWRQRLTELEREMARHAGRARRQRDVTTSLDPAGHLRGETVRLHLKLKRRCPGVEWPRVCDANFEVWSEIVSRAVPRACWYGLRLNDKSGKDLLAEAEEAVNGESERISTSRSGSE